MFRKMASRKSRQIAESGKVKDAAAYHAYKKTKMWGQAWTTARLAHDSRTGKQQRDLVVKREKSKTDTRETTAVLAIQHLDRAGRREVRARSPMMTTKTHSPRDKDNASPT